MTAGEKPLPWVVCLGWQPSVTYICPLCSFENELHYEADGQDVLEVWLDNDDDGLKCVGCRRELDADKLYASVQESVWEPE